MIFRPLIPPRELTDPIQARSPASVGPKASGPSGPLTPVTFPMVMEVAVTPMSLAVFGPELEPPPPPPLPIAPVEPVPLWLPGLDPPLVGPTEAAPPGVEPTWDVSVGPVAPDGAELACPGVTELAPLADWLTWPACTKAELGRRVPHAASPSEAATTTAASRVGVLMS